jgi:hypothetical protein
MLQMPNLFPAYKDVPLKVLVHMVRSWRLNWASSGT